MIRTADVKRGWGKFYSKSCKAKLQDKYNNSRRHRTFDNDPDGIFSDQDHLDCLDSIENSWDGHKDLLR